MIVNSRQRSFTRLARTQYDNDGEFTLLCQQLEL